MNLHEILQANGNRADMKLNMYYTFMNSYNRLPKDIAPDIHRGLRRIAPSKNSPTFDAK